MNVQDSSDELRVTAKQYIESLWKADIYRDFDDLIKFLDGEKHQIPRQQDDIEQILQQIEHYASLLADELVERWNDVGIYSLADIRRDSNTNIEHIKICEDAFLIYTAKVKKYVKSQQPSKRSNSIT
jgi:hypothetical protein